MNDIDILEELAISTRTACECGLTSGSEKEKWLKEAQAIENLVSRVKELETIEQIHREDNGKLQEKVTEYEEIDLTQTYLSGIYAERDIWKNKIKEKIEELEKQDRESKFSKNYLVIPILQELLQEER